MQIYPRMLHVWLVGGWTTPLEKYARQIGSFPQVQVGVKIQKCLSCHHLDGIFTYMKTHKFQPNKSKNVGKYSSPMEAPSRLPVQI